MIHKIRHKNGPHAVIHESRFWKGQRLLVVAPHPDDEVYGCGGTMAKAKALGCEVYVMIYSVGDLKFFEKRGVVKAAERLKEVEKVSEILHLDGIEVIYKDAETHLRLDRIPRRDLIAWLERKGSLSLEKIRPTILALPAPSYNQDHEAVFEAGFTAARIHAGGLKATPETVLVYDSPTLSWNYYGREFHPNFYVDISQYLDTKKRLVQAYASQKRHPSDPTGLQSLEEIARVRGREVGRGACEGYMAYRFLA